MKNKKTRSNAKNNGNTDGFDDDDNNDYDFDFDMIITIKMTLILKKKINRLMVIVMMIIMGIVIMKRLKERHQKRTIILNRWKVEIMLNKKPQKAYEHIATCTLHAPWASKNIYKIVFHL